MFIPVAHVVANQSQHDQEWIVGGLVSRQTLDDIVHRARSRSVHSYILEVSMVALISGQNTHVDGIHWTFYDITPTIFHISCKNWGDPQNSKTLLCFDVFLVLE